MTTNREKDTETHESFGTMVVTRSINGSDVQLFGSSIKHSSTVSMSISKADRNRHLSRDWIHPTDEIIEIEMSQAQFADMITSAGLGGGTPVTIRKIQGKRTEPVPGTSVRQKFSREFDKSVSDLKAQLESLENIAKDVLTKSTSKKEERESLLREINRLSREVSSNIPYIAKSFNESIDKVVGEARQEIEAHYQDRVTSLGKEGMMESLKTAPTDALEYKNNTEE